MNSKAAFFFATLLVIHLTFAIFLFLIQRIFHRKEVAYIAGALLLKAILALGPALLMFDIDISWNAYLTGTVKVTILPLTYLYLKKLSENNKGLTRSDLWHFLPAAISVVLTLIVVPGHAHEIVGQKNETLQSTVKMVWENSLHHNILAVTSRIISFCQGILYPVWIVILYKKHVRVIKENYSLISYYNALWIKWVIVMILLQAFFEGFGLLGIYNIPFMFPAVFFFQFVYAFFFIIHATIQKDLSPIFNTIIETPPALHDQETKQIFDRFKSEKIFLKPDISLDEMARKLGISRNKLTQMIKGAGYANFYDFINYYRVEESKILLAKMPSHYVIDAIVEQAGFKSRSTFYRVFKQTTGKTPGEYASNH